MIISWFFFIINIFITPLVTVSGEKFSRAYRNGSRIPRRRGRWPSRGRQHTILPKLKKKNCMELRKFWAVVWGGGGGRVDHFRSATGIPWVHFHHLFQPASRTMTACQTACNSDATCEAVDFDYDYNTCYFHTATTCANAVGSTPLNVVHCKKMGCR